MGGPTASAGPATLGDMLEQRLDVFCWCNRCCHWSVLAAAPLTARLGPAMPVPNVARHLVCSSCGARDIATRPAWPSGGVVSRH
jgi:hypothetical protein